MFIHSLKAKNVLSFGPEEQQLSDLKKMNLLIGRNGTGKTNIFRMLGDFDYEINPITGAIPVNYHELGFLRMLNVYSISMGESFRSTRVHLKYQYTGCIEITYLDLKATQKKIRFENDKLVEGDIKALEAVKIIRPDWSDAEFIKSIGRHDDPFEQNLILNFGLRYIFQEQHAVLWDAAFGNQFTRNDHGQYSSGSHTDQKFKPGKWPSGVLNVAKIIQQMRSSYNKVYLIEEPELHLEPRAIRRLIEFLRWFSTPDEELDNAPELVSRVNDEWMKHFSKLQEGRPKKELKPPQRFTNQFFISSHSPVLINEFIKMGQDQAQIYELRTDWLDSSWQPDDPEFGIQKQETLFTYVRKVESNAHSILDNLGASGADILQCNGVVWVEGPSDAIYLKSWLNMYSRENGLPQFMQGSHFEFQMYGGTLLDSISLIHRGRDIPTQGKKLVEMFSFSRNAYIVVDSDAVKLSDGKIIDKSYFSKAKLFIESQVHQLNRDGYKLGLWYPEGDAKLRTIEDYLDADSLSVGTSSTKKIAAQKRVALWEKKTLNDFPEALGREVKKLYEQIRDWQI